MVHIAASSPFQTQHVEPARGLQDVTELKNLFLDSLEQRFKGSPQDVNTLPAMRVDLGCFVCFSADGGSLIRSMWALFVGLDPGSVPGQDQEFRPVLRLRLRIEPHRDVHGHRAVSNCTVLATDHFVRVCSRAFLMIAKMKQ